MKSVYSGSSIIAGCHLPVSVCKVQLEIQEITVEGKMTLLIDMNESSRENEGIDARRRSGGDMNTLLVLWMEEERP